MTTWVGDEHTADNSDSDDDLSMALMQGIPGACTTAWLSCKGILHMTAEKGTICF